MTRETTASAALVYIRLTLDPIGCTSARGGSARPVGPFAAMAPASEHPLTIIAQEEQESAHLAVRPGPRPRERMSFPRRVCPQEPGSPGAHSTVSRVKGRC